jgi:hypothetical protein
MRSFTVFALVGIGLSGCANNGLTSQAALTHIQPGMSRTDVVAMLGEPGNRSFRGQVEALTYCKHTSDFISNREEYATIWLTAGKVQALTTDNRPLNISSCKNFPPMDWANAPSEVRLLIEAASRGE